jgi:hypothetical protein
MKSAIAAVVILAASLFAQEKSAPASPVTVIRAGTLLDGKSDTPRHNQVIIIKGNRIESVGDASAQIPAGATVIDLSKATVLPGLIDSHTHIFLQGEDPAEGGYDANILKYPASLRAAYLPFRAALWNSFTTLRDVKLKAPATEMSASNRRSRAAFPARACLSRRAPFRSPADTTSGYAPELIMPKGAQIVDGPVEAKAARSNSTTAPTGSRST